MPENEAGAAESADDGAAAVAVAPPPPPPPGKHRISAELKRLEQEARFLEGNKAVSSSFMDFQLAKIERIENDSSNTLDLFCQKKELEEVEKTEEVSAALQEFLFKVESKPDPLLPVTNGPANPSWDRWFEGPQDMRRCKCWII